MALTANGILCASGILSARWISTVSGILCASGILSARWISTVSGISRQIFIVFGEIFVKFLSNIGATFAIIYELYL